MATATKQEVRTTSVTLKMTFEEANYALTALGWSMSSDPDINGHGEEVFHALSELIPASERLYKADSTGANVKVIPYRR